VDAPQERVTETIHIVSTCTDRKRVPVTDDRRLREVDEATPRHRARAWWSRLRSSPTIDLIPARHLYAGEHWIAVLELQSALPRQHGPPRTWVASAGYGLVGWDAPLKSYSATFASGVEDSVLPNLPPKTLRAPLLQEWWDAISSFPGPELGEPRRVAALAEGDPDGAILVVASPDYVRAMEPDLLAARDRLTNPDRLVVISNGTALEGGALTEHLIPVDQHARAVVGGTMQGLNARVALALLRGLGRARLDATTLRSHYAAMTRDASTPALPKGEPMTDDQVLAFIREELAASPNAKQTRLLRKLRDSGRSCEQARFRGLYQRVTQTS
jgi:hypothetical protein